MSMLQYTMYVTVFSPFINHQIRLTKQIPAEREHIIIERDNMDKK